MTTLLQQYVEPAPRTADHQAMRAAAPADITLYDEWHVTVHAIDDADGAPAGVAVTRSPAVSTLPPHRHPHYRDVPRV